MEPGAPQAAPSAAASAVLDALRRILRPLVRLLITRSIPFPVATEVLRRLYVEIAAAEFAVDGKRPTDSRVHLLTGVHRKDVKRLRNERHDPASPPKKSSLTSLLIAQWTTLDEYRDADGRPLALPRAGRDTTSFESLVRSVNTDIRPRVVLDEWQRLGIAEVDDDGRVRLRVEAFVPPQGSDEILHYLGRNSGDHLSAAVHNVLGEGRPLFERAASYDHLTAEAVEELRTLAERHGMEALRTVNRRAMALQRRDEGRDGATHRMSFGAYFLDEDEERDAGTGRKP